MEVTYEKILEHYVLKEGDTLCLHGIQHRVDSVSGHYFLNNHSRINSEIFQVLGINKVSFCEKIVGVKTYGGDFPEVKTLSDLTIVVKALYERSPYWVGEKVKLKDDIHGCPWVVDAMKKDAGKVVTIKDITLVPFSEQLNGDPHQYRFEEIICTWSPQTIDHKVEDAEVVEDTRDKVCRPVEKPNVVTCNDLKKGYILKPKDTIFLDDMQYRVSTDPCLFICSDKYNSAIFSKLGLSAIEKQKWAATFGEIRSGDFPVFDSYENLTRFVLDIFDKVDILHKGGAIAVRRALGFEKDDDSHCSCASSDDTDMKSSTDCRLVEESIIIQKPKSKIKTTIKL